MLIKYFNLLILFGILLLGIIGTFAENNELSSDIQIRKKRVIDFGYDDLNLIQISQAPYVVNIERRGSRACVGSILTHDVIITVAHCVEHAVTEYQVFSGSHILAEGSRHNVSNKIIHENYDPRTFNNDLALLEIYPLIPGSSNSYPIKIYEGIIHSRQTASIIGWGCPLHSRHNQNLLRRIYVPLIRYDRCVNMYQHLPFHISEKNICTFDPVGNKRCSVGDFGAPLVVNNRLIGMYIWTGPTLGEINKPDVFIYLNDIEYRQWINTKVHGIGLYLGSRSH